ncbi:MAG: uroporphyrinogen-III synthase [Myxococcota bacterium]
MDGFASSIGKPRILVTRPAEDASSLAHALSRAGFEPVVVPLLLRRWCVDAVAETAKANPDIDWVVVTSGTAAQILATAAPDRWPEARWAAVGPTTAAKMQQIGFPVDVVPEQATAAHLVDALGDLTGQKVLYPRADLASPSTRDALRAAGAELLDVVAYENVAPEGYESRLRNILPVAATTLLSGSAAERLADALSERERRRAGRIVCLGPSTAQVAHRFGLEVAAVARPHTVSGLLEALVRLFDRIR